MQKTFNADKKTFNANVVACIQLHEAPPSPQQVSQLQGLQVKKEGVAGKRALGIGLIIAAVLLAIGAIFLIDYLPGIRMGNYEVTFIPYIIFLPALGALVLGITMFGRKIAVKPEGAFKKTWGTALCTAPDYVMEGTATFREHIFNLPETAAKTLAGHYPFAGAQVPLQTIYWFMGSVKEMVLGCFAQYGTPLADTPVYAVTYDKNPTATLQASGVALVQGKVNVIRCLANNKQAAECVELSVTTYYIQVGKYWVPANLVPYFVQLPQPAQQAAAIQ